MAQDAPYAKMRASLVVLFVLASCRSAPPTAEPAMTVVPPATTHAAVSFLQPEKDAGGAPPRVASPRLTASARPQTKQACDACAGKWAVHGIAETPSCICKTRDGGRVCRDGADCEGQCLVAQNSKFEVVSPGPPARGYYIGRCSEFDTTFGCNRVLPRGARARGPLTSSEAVDDLCVD